jgi:hypothetical protein
VLSSLLSSQMLEIVDAIALEQVNQFQEFVLRYRSRFGMYSVPDKDANFCAPSLQGP